MAWPAVVGAVAAGVSAVGGLISANKAGKLSQSQKNLINQQVEIANDLRGMGGEQYDLYNEYAGDVYDGLFEEINKGPEYEKAMGLAVNDVNQSFDNLEERTERENFRYGVNPASGRYQDTMRRNGIDRSLAVVGSKNKARRDEDDKQWAKMLTGADAVQGFFSNSVNANNAAMGGTGQAASGYGNMASNAASSASNGLYAAGYFANQAMQDNNKPGGGENVGSSINDWYNNQG